MSALYHDNIVLKIVVFVLSFCFYFLTALTMSFTIAKPTATPLSW